MCETLGIADIVTTDKIVTVYQMLQHIKGNTKPVWYVQNHPKSRFLKHPLHYAPETLPHQGTDSQTAGLLIARLSRELPNAFTRAGLLDETAFRNIPLSAVLCVSVCHLLLGWTDKTGWRGTA